MAKGYRPVRRDQLFLLPPDMREWLPADHVVWLVIDAVGRLDTSAAHAVRRTGGAGTAGYDPDMLVTLLVWAYANGVTSSRRMEAACRTDVAFRVICAGGVPDHVTIARFRAAFPQLAGELFTQVLVLCARLGLGQLGVVALDGTKIAASASKDANRTEAGLRKLAAARVAEHAAADAAEDELFGEGRRGDELPPGVGSRGERIVAALRELEDERRAAQVQRETQARQYLQALAAGQPPPGQVPAAAGVQAAQIRLERAEAAQRAKVAAWQAQRAAQEEAGIRRGPGGAKPPLPPEEHFRVIRARAALQQALARSAGTGRNPPGGKHASHDPVRNITDPDSRLMPTRNGFIQGYNAQQVTTADQLIIATTLTQDTTDTASYEPLLRQAEDAARLITASHPPAPDPGPRPAGPAGSLIGLFLADAGYLSEHNLLIDGPDRLIATGSRRTLEHAARDGTTARPSQPVAAMTQRLATPAGIAAYRQRSHIAETPHGHIKHNLGFHRLTMRGKTKATAEWTFTCTVHNLLKAITSSHLTPATLATLTN